MAIVIHAARATRDWYGVGVKPENAGGMIEA
jgi:hypothetical protein